jgi:hypothetical protein
MYIKINVWLAWVYGRHSEALAGPKLCQESGQCGGVVAAAGEGYTGRESEEYA